MDPTENADLLGEDAVDETVDTSTEAGTELPQEEGADVSPKVDTGEAKSLAEALDLGLKEVADHHAGKKPDAKTEVPADEIDPATGKPRERNADGTFKEAAVTDDKAKADAKAKAEKDAVDAPIPGTVAPKTAERMQTLIGLVKEKDGAIAERDRQIVQHQGFVDQIAATGATPQEYGTMMSYLSAVHSDNPEHLRLAKNLLMSELEGISLKLGEAAPGVDFLSKYPDLVAQVNNGEIKREVANEVAINRTRAANDKAQRDAAADRQRQSDTSTAERTAAQTELTNLGNELYQRDGQEYLRRYDILEPSLQALGELPPAKWKAAFMRAYNSVKPLPASMPKPATPAAAVPAAGAKGQPLRANKTPSGDAPKQGPKSLFEAIDGALKAM